jgi:hypothetical protein
MIIGMSSQIPKEPLEHERQRSIVLGFKVLKYDSIC